MLTHIKFGYWNCRGLTIGKLDTIHQMLNDELDLIIIAEHWFSQSDLLKQSPFFVKSTSRPAQERTTGHENGGLALLAKPDVQDRLTSVNASEFCISFGIESREIMSVYLPPRLSEDTVAQILGKSPSNLFLLVGDMNVRYGSLTNDTKKTCPKRTSAIDSFCRQRNLSIRVAREGRSRTDHIYATEQIDWSYGVPEWLVNLDSDHEMMLGSFNLSSPMSSLSSLTPTYKFAFSILKEPVMQQLLRHHWNLIHDENVSRLIHKTQKLPRIDQPSFTDSIYCFFMTQVHFLCKSLIPMYDTNAVRSKPRSNTNHLMEGNLSNTQAIRVFKQSQRSEAINNHIRSRTQDRTPAEEAFEHYRKTYEERLPEVLDDPIEPELQEIDVFPTPFTRQDVYDVVRQYPTHKSGGPDGFDARVFQVLIKSPKFCETLFNLFTLFFESGTTPSEWNHSLIFLLLKDESEPFADKTRPVSLTNMLRRFYEKLLLKTWVDEPWARLHNAQAGFRRGFNTLTQILTSDELSKDHQISCFLDLSAAFDRVPHKKLLDILKERGCPSHIRRIIFKLMMFQSCSTLIVNNKRISEKIGRRHGVFQGSILSPLLFNIFIDPLAELLNTEPQNVPLALFYADDITIKAKTTEKMSMLIRRCETWANQNGMRWGISKCGIIGSSSVFF